MGDSEDQLVGNILLLVTGLAYGESYWELGVRLVIEIVDGVGEGGIAGSAQRSFEDELVLTGGS